MGMKLKYPTRPRKQTSRLFRVCLWKENLVTGRPNPNFPKTRDEVERLIKKCSRWENYAIAHIADPGDDPFDPPENSSFFESIDIDSMRYAAGNIRGILEKREEEEEWAVDWDTPCPECWQIRLAVRPECKAPTMRFVADLFGVPVRDVIGVDRRSSDAFWESDMYDWLSDYNTDTADWWIKKRLEDPHVMKRKNDPMLKKLDKDIRPWRGPSYETPVIPLRSSATPWASMSYAHGPQGLTSVHPLTFHKEDLDRLAGFGLGLDEMDDEHDRGARFFSTTMRERRIPDAMPEDVREMLRRRGDAHDDFYNEEFFYAADYKRLYLDNRGDALVGSGVDAVPRSNVLGGPYFDFIGVHDSRVRIEGETSTPVLAMCHVYPGFAYSLHGPMARVERLEFDKFLPLLPKQYLEDDALMTVWERIEDLRNEHLTLPFDVFASLFYPIFQVRPALEPDAPNGKVLDYALAWLEKYRMANPERYKTVDDVLNDPRSADILGADGYGRAVPTEDEVVVRPKVASDVCDGDLWLAYRRNDWDDMRVDPSYLASIKKDDPYGKYMLWTSEKELPYMEIGAVGFTQPRYEAPTYEWKPVDD